MPSGPPSPSRPSARSTPSWPTRWRSWARPRRRRTAGRNCTPRAASCWTASPAVR